MNSKSTIVMIHRLEQAMRAMQVLQRAQEVTANNLANINTPGFKADKLFFHAFKNEVTGETTVEPKESIEMNQGSLKKTGNPFDFAIQGSGFFEVHQNGQTLLKRSGNFKLNTNGFLVDNQGAKVMGASGPIRLPSLVQSNADRSDINVNVAKDGTISINGQTYGQLKLVNVANQQNLKRLGNSYFKAPGNKIIPADETKSHIIQGYQESANVNPLTELVDMTKNMRLFQSQQRAMRTMNETLARTTTQLGKF